MEEQGYAGIVACGLDCGPCPIRRMLFDEEAAERVLAWFRSEDWLEEDEGLEEAVERSMYCRGCLGNSSVHWSADCWILECCVDEKGLQNCSECDEFPCSRLVEWSEQNGSYAKALERLREMHAARQ